MRKLHINDRRKIVSVVLVVGLIVFGFWFFSPGMPIIIGPWAFSGEKARGQELFTHEWSAYDPLAGGDGLGPVFNAKSCVACHFQGGIGGAGGAKSDVQIFQVRETKQNSSDSGLLHFASISKPFQETFQHLRLKYPIIRGSSRTVTTDGHCSYTITIPDFDPVSVETIHATPLFGAGWIDMISTKALKYHALRQSMDGSWTEVTEQKFEIRPQGKIRILPDGRVGKFGWKSQFATLKEFVAAACANELGLGSHVMDQPTPLSQPNYQAPGTDMTRGQLSDLTAFVSTLDRPIEVPSDRPFEVEQGRQAFHSVGCAICHVPDIGGVKGVYSDFLLHDITTNMDGGGNNNGGGSNNGYGPPEPPGLPPIDPKIPMMNEWRTPPLWGVADSAPYFHDGKSATLQSAILRHRGDATGVRKAYQRMSVGDQQALITFLQTLRAPANTQPVPSQNLVPVNGVPAQTLVKGR